MDSPSYYVESAVIQAPLERCIGELESSIFYLSPNSTIHLKTSEIRSEKISPSTKDGAVKIELRFDHIASSASIHVAGEKEEWIPNYVKPGVEPITAQLSAYATFQIKAIINLDNNAGTNPELSRVALRAVVDAVEDHIKNGDLWSLNELLGKVEPFALRKITNVAFLRTSFRMRNKLSNWATLYDKTMIHLKETGQDADRALRGLSRKKVTQIA